MAADVKIHVLTDEFTEEHYKAMAYNAFDSRYFEEVSPESLGFKDKFDIARIADAAPNIWIGEVSWLKAALFEDSDKYVPGPVEQIVEIIGEDFPTITEELIVKVEAAFYAPNTTKYEVAREEDVVEFLRQHKGKKVVTITW